MMCKTLINGKRRLGHISSEKIQEILFSGLTNIVRLFYKPGEIYSFGIIKS